MPDFFFLSISLASFLFLKARFVTFGGIFINVCRLVTSFGHKRDLNQTIILLEKAEIVV